MKYTYLYSYTFNHVYVIKTLSKVGTFIHKRKNNDICYWYTTLASTLNTTGKDLEDFKKYYRQL